MKQLINNVVKARTAFTKELEVINKELGSRLSDATDGTVTEVRFGWEDDSGRMQLVISQDLRINEFIEDSETAKEFVSKLSGGVKIVSVGVPKPDIHTAEAWFHRDGRFDFFTDNSVYTENLRKFLHKGGLLDA